MTKRLCAASSRKFEITEQDLAFYDRVSPIFDGTKYPIPPPTLCLEMRLRRRLAFRNNIYVYRVRAAESDQLVFSVFPPNRPFPIYPNEKWWGSGWDALEYGRNFDFSRPFFEQLKDLRDTVPHRARSIKTSENSDYSNNATGLKNCYLVFNSSYAEDSLYCENLIHSRDCIDCTRTPESELCYDCVECNNCYSLQSSLFCDNCNDSYFLTNCRSCEHCIGCTNLYRQSYCIFNKQYSKEEYFKHLENFRFESYAKRKEFQIKYDQFRLSQPTPHVHNLHTENVTGNCIVQSKNVSDSFFVFDGEDLKYCFTCNTDVKDCYDFSTFGLGAELLYECSSCGNDVSRMSFCYDCWRGNSNLLYCIQSHDSSDCFACVGLQKKQNCILNKQYTKHEYEQLAGRIINHMQETGEWGEFFPLEFSPHPYNRTMAQRYFPITPSDAEKLNLEWYEQPDSIPPAGAVKAEDLPDIAPQSDEPITAISEISGNAFRITTRELAEYRRFKVPLPRATYDERMNERFKTLGDIRLYQRSCPKSGQAILSNYEPNSPQIVWDKGTFDQEFWS